MVKYAIPADWERGRPARTKARNGSDGMGHPVADKLHRVIASCRSRSTLLFAIQEFKYKILDIFRPF